MADDSTGSGKAPTVADLARRVLGLATEIADIQGEITKLHAAVMQRPTEDHLLSSLPGSLRLPASAIEGLPELPELPELEGVPDTETIVALAVGGEAVWFPWRHLWYLTPAGENLIEVVWQAGALGSGHRRQAIVECDAIEILRVSPGELLASVKRQVAPGDA